MSSANDEINFKIKATDTASQVFRQTADNAKKANDDLLKSLKTGLGEESKFGNIAKILSGAGAVAGLALVGRELNAMADKLAEIRKLSKDGAGTGEIAEKLAISLPIFGSIIEAGRKFRAEMDGSAEAIGRITMSGKSVDANTQSVINAMARQRQDQATGIQAMMQKMQDEVAERAMGEERAAVLRRQNQLRDDLKKADDAMRDYRERLQKDNQDERDRLQEESGPAQLALQKQRDLLDAAKEYGAPAVVQTRQKEYEAALLAYQNITERQRKIGEVEKREVIAQEERTKKIKVELEAKANEDIKDLGKARKLEQDKQRSTWLMAEKSAIDTWAVMHKENAERVADIQAETRNYTLRSKGLAFEAQINELNRSHEKAVEKIRADAAVKVGLSFGNPVTAAFAQADAENEIAALEAQRTAKAGDLQDLIRQRSGRAAIQWLAPVLGGNIQTIKDAMSAYIDGQKQLANIAPLALNNLIEGGSTTGIGRALNESAAATQADSVTEAVRRLEIQQEKTNEKLDLIGKTIATWGQKVAADGN